MIFAKNKLGVGCTMKNVFKSVLFILVLVLSAAFVAANPIINPVADQTVNEGSLLTVQVTSTAPDGASPLITKLCQPAPCVPSLSEITIGSTKANFTNLTLTTAEFRWQPDFSQAGSYTFNLTVSDGDSFSNDTFVVTVNNVPPKLTTTATLALGGDIQERSDPNHDTDDKREVYVTGTITVKNDGEPVTGLAGTVAVATGFTSNDVNITFTLPKTALATGESIAVPVTVRVPQKLDAVTRALVTSAVNVATITFSATPTFTVGPVSGTTQLALQAENNLKIKDVKVRFDGKSENVDDGDTVDDMKPGMNVEFEIELENRFKDKEDVTIEDVEVKVISGGELDIDESEDVGDLGAEDKETVKLESSIDADADDGTFSVEISAEGVDEFGARHGERIVVDFEVKRKSHEIEIKSVTLNPPTVSCEKETRLTADIRNSGRRDEDDVVVRLTSPELSFGAVSDKLSLDQDDEDTVSFNIPVPESIARPANYRVTVDTYFNTDTKSNSEVVLLSVAKCGAEDEKEKVTPPEEGKKDEVTVITVPPTQPQVNVTPQEQPAAKKSFLETPQYVALLVLGYVVVLGGGAALLIKLMKPQ